MSIEILPYNPNWATLYATESRRIAQYVSDIAFDIAHIGSTSVEGLGAKPIIDIMVGLHNFEHDAPNWVEKMQALSYIYKTQYEHLMPYRRYFTLHDHSINPDAPLLYHLHTVAIGSEFWDRHLLFRNYLRLKPDVLTAYYQLKLDLAQKDWQNQGDYADAKTPFIRQIEAEARDYFRNCTPKSIK